MRRNHEEPIYNRRDKTFFQQDDRIRFYGWNIGPESSHNLSWPWNFNSEIIEHGKTGLVIPVHSVSALHDAMKVVIEDKIDHRKISENCGHLLRFRFIQKDLNELVS